VKKKQAAKKLKQKAPKKTTNRKMSATAKKITKAKKKLVLKKIAAKPKLRDMSRPFSREKLEEQAKRQAYESIEMAKDTELLSMRYTLPAGLEKELENMPWETVANLANTFKLKIEGENAELKKLEKEIEFTRLIVLQRIAHHQKVGGFDYKFFVDLVNLLERCEKLAAQHEVDLEEFTRFVYILIEKMKKEKLIVYESNERKYRRRSDADSGAFCRIRDSDFGAGLP